MRAVQGQLSCILALRNPRECAQIRKADPDGLQLHFEDGLFVDFWMARAYGVASLAQQFDPFGDEMAGAIFGFVKLPGESGGAASARSVAHDDDFLDLELR